MFGSLKLSKAQRSKTKQRRRDQDFLIKIHQNETRDVAENAAGASPIIPIHSITEAVKTTEHVYIKLLAFMHEKWTRIRL